jgi:hypothetical protein
MDNEPDNQAETDEARAYIEDLPDETAAGRLVTDTGEPADEEAWQAEHERQEGELGGEE